MSATESTRPNGVLKPDTSITKPQLRTAVGPVNQLLSLVQRCHDRIKSKIRQNYYSYMLAELRAWRSIQSISQEVKRKYIHSIALYLELRFRLRRTQRRFVVWIGMPGGLLILSSLTIMTVLYVRSHPLLHEIMLQHKYMIILGYLLMLLGGMPTAILRFLETGSFVMKQYWSFSILGWTFFLFFISCLSTLIAITVDNDNCLAIAIMFSLSTIFSSVVLLFSYSMSRMTGFLRSRMEQQAPAAALAGILFDVVWMLEKDGWWRYSRHRAEIIRALEEGARLIQTRLFREFEARNNIVHLVREERAISISNALRNKELWLITPKQDTRQILLNQISQMLVSLLNGNWDDFEGLGDHGMTEQPRLHGMMTFFMNRMLNLFRVALVATLPVIIYIVSDFFPQTHIISPLREYVQAGVILWSILTVISALDPLLRDKVSTIKDLFSVGARSDKK
jgi:hypothetical protein